MVFSRDVANWGQWLEVEIKADKTEGEDEQAMQDLGTNVKELNE